MGRWSITYHHVPNKPNTPHNVQQDKQPVTCIALMWRRTSDQRAWVSLLLQGLVSAASRVVAAVEAAALLTQ